MKKLKVLHIGQMIGGLEIYIRNTVMNVNDQFHFIIVRGEGDNSKPIVKKDSKIKEYKIKLYRSPNIISDIKCIYDTVRIIKKNKPDIIHCHSAKGGFIGRVAGFLTNTKTFYTPHAFSFLSTNNILAKNFYLFIERHLKLNSNLLACSESEKEIGLNVVRYKPVKTYLWKNAIPDPVEIEIVNKKDNAEKFACFVGRPSFQKNTFFLAEVVEKVCVQIPDFKIYLIGVGFYSPDLDAFEKLIKQHKLEKNIILVPWLSQEEAFSYVKQSCFYLSVSRYEGLPLSVLEAMSLSKALILSQVPGNIDCVENEYNGYSLPLDIQLFANKIIELWNNPEKCGFYGKNSRSKYLKEFDITNQINLLESIYSGNCPPSSCSNKFIRVTYKCESVLENKPNESKRNSTN